MNSQQSQIGEIGLQFFGKISASVSHELKNSLAVINENAGLIDDLALMSERGMPVDPEKLKSISAKIIKQIHRADEIIKNMNRFSHSVDEPVRHISVDEMLMLLAALCKRFASNRGLTVEIISDKEPTAITTHPYFLLMLVFQILETLFYAQGKGKIVLISLQHKENRKQIRISRKESMINPADFPTENERVLSNYLNFRLEFDKQTEEFVIGLSE